MNAKEQGRFAYLDDKSLKDNPFEMGSSEHNEWEKGFKIAERDDPLAPHNMID